MSAFLAARQVYCIDAPRLWRVIWLLPAMMSGIVTIFTGILEVDMVGTWQFILTRTNLLLCVVVVYWVLLSALDGLRQQRHDLRHQLTAIRGLAGEDNPLLNQYIDSLLHAIPVSPRTHCENQAVNAIVSHYAAYFQEQRVEADIHLSVPARTEQVTDAELCVIFGNLMENALEACSRMTEGRKFIRLNSAVQLDTLIITMDNSFDGQVRQRDGKYLSSKRDDFGVGLSSIQAVARKRGGNARFEPDGRVFCSSVYVSV